MPRETVLVVDDDEATRQACRAALETARFRVAEAADLPAATRALDHLKAASTTCDLALVDYRMPEQNGFNVFHHLRRAQPDLAGILLTGHTSLNVAVEALNRSFSQVVPKPIEPGGLLEAVESALAERRTVLENARLRALTRLYDALDQLASVTDIEGLYRCIVRLAVEEISADSASLMLLDERRMNLYVASAHGYATPPVGGGKHVYGEPICGWVLRHGVALELAPGKPLPAAVRAAMHRPDVRAAVCLPLCPGGRPLGVLNINRYGDGGGFLPGDLEVATVLAGDAALTIQRLVLLEERRRRERSATVGRLASTIIHDLRGPITIIGGAAEMLIDAGPAAAAPLGRVIDGVGELDRMCQQLLSFARDASTMVTETLQVNEFVEGLAAAAAPSFRAGGVQFQWQCDGDGSVEAAGAELFRAALDVLEAASAAASPGATVTLAAACQPEGFGLAVAGSAADPHACWRELDEAGALAAGGSELTLAVARRVVQRHGGKVALETRGEEYTLHLLIPLRPRARAAGSGRDSVFAAP